jgi:murein DD-endopeptidase MepM/ murein hydrolase activator NlpD
MSSKAEKTSNHSHQQPRLNIFFRSPLLLKIVAWLGSLSFLSSTGMVWADLKPISIAKTDVPELIQAPASPVAGNVSAKPEDREIYGPYLPIAQKPSPVQTSSAQLPNREVPIAVAPADAVILPTGTIVRPQHTDILTAENYTVGVNESSSEPTAVEDFISIAVPTPLNRTMPTQSREVISATVSQVQPANLKSQSIISQSAPTTSIQSKSQLDRSDNGYRAVPAVANIPNPSLPRFSRTGSGSSLPTSTATKPAALPGTQRRPLTPQVVPLLGLRNTVVAPMKPVVTAQTIPTKPAAILATTPAPAEDSIEISVPAPRTRQMVVQPVAHLPQISATKAVPNVPAIPSVRPAAMMNSQSPVAFVNTGETSAQLIYPLSSPAPTTSSFGWRTHPITGSRRFHSGVDIGAPMGAPVVAAGTGIVMSSGWLGGYGKAIVIQHNGVQQTLYGHLSEVFVQPGQRIEQGTVIGRVGSTGNSTGPHLHFETKVATTDGWVAIDPGDDIKYALDNLRRAAPFAQRDLPPGYN